MSNMFPTFGQDEEGSISIEFVLVMPILILWLLGSFVFFDAFRSFSQIEKIAYAVADAASRDKTMNSAKITELRDVHERMSSHRTTNKWLRISSICFLDGNYYVKWSETRSDATVTVPPLTDATIPLEIMPVMVNQDTIILAEVSGRWTPLSTSVGAQQRDFNNALVVRPRRSRAITHDTLNTNPLCIAPTPPGGGGGSSGPGDDGVGGGS